MNKENQSFSNYLEATTYSKENIDINYFPILSNLPKPVRRDVDAVWLDSLVTTSPKTTISIHAYGEINDKYYHHESLYKYIRNYFIHQQCKDEFWIRAIKNLYKRINFLQLNIELLQEDIDETYFENELTENEDRYVITMQDIKDYTEAQAINDIVRAIGISLDTHEVSELFGVENESLYRIQGKI